jgi:quinol monooxygenase YgiN
MPLYQIKIVMKKYKIDEFVDFLHSLLPGLHKEKGCVDCSVYQDLDEQHAYCIVAKWETHEAMQKHFLTQKFEVLIGAARVLGDTFEISMAEILESGCFELSDRIAARNTTN